MILLKKAFRSMIRNFSSYFACVILISVGVFILISMGVSSGSLENSKEEYYEDYNLADIFIDLSEIPKASLNNLGKIQGVKEYSGRNVFDTRVSNLKEDKIVTLRLISYDETSTNLNNYYLQEGTDLKDDNEILVSDEFLDIYNINIGESIFTILDREEEIFVVTGSVLSPEYIYAIKDSSMVVPDQSVFSYGFVKEDKLEYFAKTKGTYNNVSISIEEGYKYEDIKWEIEEALGKQNILRITKQKDLSSERLISDEIDGIQGLIGTIPLIFIVMAMIILYLMLTRVIEEERGEIGTMKAFGYSNGTVLFHYLSYGIITGIAGGLLGCLLGNYGAKLFINIYRDYYKVPSINEISYLSFYMEGMIISISGGFAGSFFGAISILSLHPADAMRAKAPRPVKHDLISYLPFLSKILTSRGSMAIRNIERSKVRSFFISIGIMFAFSLMALLFSFMMMFDDVLIEEFEKISLYDGKVIFKKQIDYNSGIENIYELGEIELAEYLFEVPATLKYKNNAEYISITGINQDSNLIKIYDNEKDISLAPSKEGIIITDGLSVALGVSKGEFLYVESLYEKDDIRLMVVDIVSQSIGMKCYMDIDALAEALNTRKMATSIIFDTSDFKHIEKEIYEGDNISSINDSLHIKEKYYELLSTYSIMIYVFAFLAGCVAFAIIYNTSIISLSERTREYTTLMVLGLHVEEVAEIMIFEYQILSILGMAIGIPFTIFLKRWIASMVGIKLFSIPKGIAPICYLVGMVGCIIFVHLSNRGAKNRIGEFDLVEVLKERE